MRATKEMRERAILVAREQLPGDMWDHKEERDHDISLLVRLILEAALADVPEPFEPWRAEMRTDLVEWAKGLERTCVERSERIAELEARIARARAHLTDDGWHAKTFDEGRLLALLDGKEQP